MPTQCNGSKFSLSVMASLRVYVFISCTKYLLCFEILQELARRFLRFRSVKFNSSSSWTAKCAMYLKELDLYWRVSRTEVLSGFVSSTEIFLVDNIILHLKREGARKQDRKNRKDERMKQCEGETG